jgi:hypothetical protein
MIQVNKNNSLPDYGIITIKILCKHVYIWVNYNNSRSPESCGYFGLVTLTNHDSRVRENSEVFRICPDICKNTMVIHGKYMIYYSIIPWYPIIWKKMTTISYKME